jgi:hypothetical protein
MNGIYNQEWYINGTSLGLMDDSPTNMGIVDQNWWYNGYVINKWIKDHKKHDMIYICIYIYTYYTHIKIHMGVWN